MKKIKLIFLTILIPFLTNAQIKLELSGNVNREIRYQIGDITSTINEGTSVTLKYIYKKKGISEAKIFNNDKNMLSPPV